MEQILLDLFCGQGGASEGYYRAGFLVVGVDVNPQPHYPFEFVQADALEFLRRPSRRGSLTGMRFAGVHASPPCQFGSKTQRIQGNEHPNLIGPTRDALLETGLPYVIENVPDVRDELRDPIELCGAMFGLRVYRHRLFETNFPCNPLWHPPHHLKQVKMGRPPAWDEMHQPVGNFSAVQEGRDAMEMPWATRDGVREAIPPAYAEHVGGHLLYHLNHG